MREILFKAKRIDNGEWVEGYYVRTRLGLDVSFKDVIFVPWKENRKEEWGWINIIPETICQYTGLTDKNGKRIWENDIVNYFEAECCGKISWNESEAGFYFDVLLEDGTYEEEHIYDYADCMMVIGNIFDNPEPLEVGE